MMLYFLHASNEFYSLLGNNISLRNISMAMPVTEDGIKLAYRILVDREPDSVGMSNFLQYSDMKGVVAAIRQSGEFANTVKNSPLYWYNGHLDAEKIVRDHENPDCKAVPDRLVNYLGVVIDPAFLPSLLNGRQGQVEGAPIPANWHADMAEFAAVLRAVDLASGTFRMCELGCGWGCWLLNSGAAARRRGLELDLIGVEGDAGHAAFARQGLRENGFTEAQARVHRNIVGAKAGTALFPRQDVAGEQWGLEAVFGASEDDVRTAEASGKYDILPIVTFDDLVPDGQVIDLLHIDIQGVEADFIDACVDRMNDLVAYIMVGTHSREIEGRVFATLLANGWHLEIERPALIAMPDGQPYTTIDGVQGWRNPRLR